MYPDSRIIRKVKRGNIYRLSRLFLSLDFEQEEVMPETERELISEVQVIYNKCLFKEK